MGTKIMVVQLKELIRTILFVIAGIALIILLIYFFFPKGNADSPTLYEPGVYTASIVLQNNPIEVVVEVTDKEITSIQLHNMAETQEVFYPLIQPTMDSIAEEIIKTQSLTVDLPADSETTGKVLLSAVDSALKQARIVE